MQRCVLGISYLYHINDLGILHVTFSKIQLVNLDILVQTPGRLASAHPIPQLIMPPKKYLPSRPRICNGPPESPY